MVLKPLNDRQAALLQRIGDAVRPVTSREPELAASVYALRNRRLVRTPRTDGVWRAELTDDGRYYLEHGRYAATSARPETVAPQAWTGRHRDPAISGADVMTQIIAAGGKMTVADPDPATRAAWRQAIYRAINDGLVPAGQQLRHTGRNRGDLHLSLVDAEVDTSPSIVLAPIPVPERLSRPHRVISATRAAAQTAEAKQTKGWISTLGVPSLFQVRVSRPQFDRALRLLQALVDEALRRDHQVEAVTGASIVVRGHACHLVLVEETDRVPHQLTASERAKVARDSWYRPPTHDHVPSGRLQLRLNGQTYGRTSTWSDRQRWKLDDRLPHALAAIEATADEAEARQREEERRRQARRLAWEAAMQSARDQLREDYRRSVLENQVRDWHLAVNIRAYCAALQAASPVDGGTTDHNNWIAWAELCADAIDPLRRSALQPADPEPTASALQPHLPRGFDAYGPSQYWLAWP